MWIKYIVTDNNWTVGMKINPITSKAVIGGLVRHLNVIDTLRIEYFKRKVLFETAYPNHNKIKYTFTCTIEIFREVVNQMQTDNLIVQEVSKHDRLLR